MALQSIACFHKFKSPIDSIVLPPKFTDPFSAKPHGIAIIAANELKTYLLNQTEITHDFGLNTTSGIGKMIGVLVVKNENDQLGYLAGFSGKLQGNNQPTKFVPSIFEANESNSFLSIGLTKVTQINAKISEIENHPEFIKLKVKIKQFKDFVQTEIEDLSERMKREKKDRKQNRNLAKDTLNKLEFDQLLIDLAKQSVANKKLFKEFSARKLNEIAEQELLLNEFQDQLVALKTERSTLSASMQEKLFENYTFLNQNGEQKSVNEIFALILNGRPPAAAGECATPKMLQFAFKNELKPIAVAEFWWGKSQKAGMRVHENYYPACETKCRPILKFMLK